jgi:rare lipoprotein A
MRRMTRWMVPVGLVLLVGCATAGGRHATLRASSEVGLASFYAHRYHGQPTASGIAYDEHDLTAAHPTLPFGTRVRVTNLENDRSVVVKITDRGPFVRGRVIDVSRRAARDLGFLGAGTARVRVEVLPG